MKEFVAIMNARVWAVTCATALFGRLDSGSFRLPFTCFEVFFVDILDGCPRNFMGGFFESGPLLAVAFVFVFVPCTVKGCHIDFLPVFWQIIRDCTGQITYIFKWHY